MAHGPTMAIAAFFSAKLSPLYFSFGARPSLYSVAQKFAAARWPGYRYLEYVSGRQELAEIYRAHDILLAPGPYETFGLAVLEAMASGLVVVGSQLGHFLMALVRRYGFRMEELKSNGALALANASDAPKPSIT